MDPHPMTDSASASPPDEGHLQADVAVSPGAPEPGRPSGRARGRGRGRPDAIKKAEVKGPEAKGSAAKAKGRSGAAARPPHPVLQRLYELYPRMFGARFLPLKLGVFQELLARHPEDFKKEELKLALGLHARSTRYLESIAAGEKRHDLDGRPVEDVAPEHVHHAILEVYRRRQARSREDQRPWLRERLIRAIEGSGLPRQDYAERFTSGDPQVAQVMEEALSEVGERSARREALRRAYEASGRTPAEFAEMYGMELAAVERALAEPPPRLARAPSAAPEAEAPAAGPEADAGAAGQEPSAGAASGPEQPEPGAREDEQSEAPELADLAAMAGLAPAEAPEVAAPADIRVDAGTEAGAAPPAANET